LDPEIVLRFLLWVGNKFSFFSNTAPVMPSKIDGFKKQQMEVENFVEFKKFI
jgi:hypothetical protein